MAIPQPTQSDLQNAASQILLDEFYGCGGFVLTAFFSKCFEAQGGNALGYEKAEGGAF